MERERRGRSRGARGGHVLNTPRCDPVRRAPRAPRASGEVGRTIPLRGPLPCARPRAPRGLRSGDRSRRPASRGSFPHGSLPTAEGGVRKSGRGVPPPSLTWPPGRRASRIDDRDGGVGRRRMPPLGGGPQGRRSGRPRLSGLRAEHAHEGRLVTLYRGGTRTENTPPKTQGGTCARCRSGSARACSGCETVLG